MTYAPASISALAAYWVKQGGINSGIVGNSTHCKGYHLGKDRIYGSCACKPGGVCKPGLGADDYSVKLARDKAGLSNASSALDLGKINGSLSQLFAFNRWFVKQVQDQPEAYRDVREVIYSPDGKVVKRWDNYAKKLYTGGDGTGQGDNSHLWHTHISFFRDSEARPKVQLFSPYFDSTEADMGLKVYLTATKDANPWDDFVTAKLTVAGARRVSDGASVAVAAGTNLNTVQLGTLDGQAIIAFNHNGELHVAPKANATVAPMTPPSGPADCTDAVNAAKVAGFNEGKAAGIAETEPKVAAAAAAEKERIALAEAGRIRDI